MHILRKATSWHLFLWPTASKWYCTFCERLSHHIFSYDQQRVSDIAHFVKGSLITSFPMTNSLWVTLHILQRQSHQSFSYDQQFVCDIPHFLKGSLMACFPITNRKWVTLHILWKAISSYLFVQPTESEWQCTLYERQPHYMYSYDEQRVSAIAHFVKGSLITFFLWPTVLQHTDSTLCIADTSDRPVLFSLPIYRFTLRWLLFYLYDTYLSPWVRTLRPSPSPRYYIRDALCPTILVYKLYY